MRINFRDYYISVSVLGVLLCYYGLFRLSVPPKYEVVGGIEVVIGAFVALWGLILLRFSADQELGYTEQLLTEFLRRKGLAD